MNNAHDHPEPTLCAKCGKPFTPKCSWQRFCSNSCRSGNWQSATKGVPRCPARKEISLSDALAWMELHHLRHVEGRPVGGAELLEFCAAPQPNWLRLQHETNYRRGYMHGWSHAIDALNALIDSIPGQYRAQVYNPLCDHLDEKLTAWMARTFHDVQDTRRFYLPPHFEPPPPPKKPRQKQAKKPDQTGPVSDLNQLTPS